MTSLNTAIAALERARSIRATAESRAAESWKDGVYRELERCHLDPLATEEARYLATVRAIDFALDRCLRQLNAR